MIYYIKYITKKKQFHYILDKFIIFEDKYAMKTNFEKANEAGYEKIPEITH